MAPRHLHSKSDTLDYDQGSVRSSFSAGAGGGSLRSGASTPSAASTYSNTTSTNINQAVQALLNPQSRMTLRNQLSLFLDCCRGPELYYKYGKIDNCEVLENGRGKVYEANTLEITSTKVIKMFWATVNMLSNPFAFFFVSGAVGAFWAFGVFSGQVLSGNFHITEPWTWHRPYFQSLGGLCARVTLSAVISLSFSFATVAASTWLLRGYGRFSNPEYMEFLQTISQPSSEFDLRRYDYEYQFQPTDYQKSCEDEESERTGNGNEFAAYLKTLPQKLVALHFGRPMMYPGSTLLLNSFVKGTLDASRRKLLESSKAKRMKVKISKHSHIDCLFIDKRRSLSAPPSPDGMRRSGFRSASGEIHSFTSTMESMANVARDISSHQQTSDAHHSIEREIVEQENFSDHLVITCEGNGSYYEMGVMLNIVPQTYSVLGWNHPGFGDSSGVPSLENEQKSIDTLIDVATKKLKFPIDKIIVYGWSIGGYPAAYAATKYQNLGGVILDATFDHVLPLALERMPKSIDGLTKAIIAGYFNLDVIGNILSFKGPVIVTRRTRDEMMGVRPYNRANVIIREIVRSRYKKYPVVDDEVLQRWLAEPEQCESSIGYSHTDADIVGRCCSVLFSVFVSGSDSVREETLNAMTSLERKFVTIFLARWHLVDIESTHCDPLPISKWRHPESLNDYLKNYNTRLRALA
eukprot:Nk52_evm15s2241 gene=Nk52_evmTU15s2241